MRCLCALLGLVLLPIGALAADPVPDVRATINRGLTFLAKDNLTWKEKRKCFECHHAPFTIWALNERKRRGYAVDDKALAELTAWAAAKTIPTRSRRHRVRSLPLQADPLSRIGSILSREVMS